MFQPIVSSLLSQVPTQPAHTDVKTVLGWFLTVALTIVAGVVAYGAVKLTQFLESKKTQGLAWNLTNTLWVKAQAIGSSELNKDKELLSKILADGKVTPEEFATLKTAVVSGIRALAVSEVQLLGPVLGLFGDGPVATFIDGLASKVIHNILGSDANLEQIEQPVPPPPSIPPVKPVP